MKNPDSYCNVCHSHLHGEGMSWHLVCALMSRIDLGSQSAYWKHQLDAHFDDLLSQATSVEILDAYLSAIRPGNNPLLGDILVMEMVNKQDEERDAGRDPTGECGEGDAWTYL